MKRATTRIQYTLLKFAFVLRQSQRISYIYISVAHWHSFDFYLFRSVKTEILEKGANSSLLIAKINKLDSGNYTCSINASHSYTVSVHVLNGKRNFLLNLFKWNIRWMWACKHRYYSGVALIFLPFWNFGRWMLSMESKMSEHIVNGSHGVGLDCKSTDWTQYLPLWWFLRMIHGWVNSWNRK